MTTINVYDTTGGDLAETLERIEAKLDQLATLVAAFTTNEATSDAFMEEAMSDISARIATLQQEVAEQTTVNASAVTLLTSLTSNLQAVRDDLASRGVSEDQLSALDAQIASVSDNTDALAAAVESNTTPDAGPAPAPGEPV